MTNWRVVGEVPDSDDDDFDDFELPDQNLEYAPNSTLTAAERAQESHDDDVEIWAIPDSPPSPAKPPGPRLPTSTKPPANSNSPARRPSTPVAQPTQPTSNIDIWEPPSSSPPKHAWTPSAATPGFLPQINQQVQRPITPDASRSYIVDEHSGMAEGGDLVDGLPAVNGPPTTQGTSAVHVPAASHPTTSPLSSPLSWPQSCCSENPEPPIASSPPQPRQPSPARNPEVDDDDLEIARQTAVCLGRSLRPRKPIQQHPYLLESAQYANIMRSHGVKPIKVRMAEAEAARRRAQEEDSQEQDYEAEESQERKGTDESTPLLFDEDDGRDELAPSPSPFRTSPTGIAPRTSSQPVDGNHTPLTAFSDDDDNDLPTLSQLLNEPGNPRVRSLKRQGSQMVASRRKRRAIPSSSQPSSPPRMLIPPPIIWDLSSSPVRSPALHNVESEILGNTSPAVLQQKLTPAVSSSSLPSSLRLQRRRATVARVSTAEDDGARSDSDVSSSTGSSGSETDTVRQNVKRIRGVLPASWLRLDQKRQPTTIRNPRKSPEPPAPVPRRGVALPKQTTPKRSSTAQFPFNECDDSDDEPTREPVRSESPPVTAPVTTIYEDDDAVSVVEEDVIDHMLLGRRKRRSSPTTARKAKRQKKDGVSDRPRQVRQPRITEVMSRSERAAAPLRLSILDVIEPTAPIFLKVAARAVKNKPNHGRTSPSNKMISLASRRDNIDALSALRDWKTGKTRQRATLPTPQQPVAQKAGTALKEISHNSRSRPSQPRSRLVPTHLQRLARQGDLNDFVTVEAERRQSASSVAGSLSKRKALHDHRLPSFRPAQLETEGARLDLGRLRVHKRTLDTLYRARNISPSSIENISDLLSTLPSPPVFRSQSPEVDGVMAAEQPRAMKEAERLTKSKPRFRKKSRPRQVDLDSPEYAHSNDPLPAEVTVFAVEEPRERLQDKLRGLGPYGTIYTHHFEVFPLDRGTFFHESTLLGRGFIRKAIDPELSTKVQHHRIAVSFVLDGQTLRWGVWDDKVSSELGIVIDWVTEKLSMHDSSDNESPGDAALEAVDFVLQYVLDSMSVRDPGAEVAFVSRCLEVFSSFVARFNSFNWSDVSRDCQRTRVEVGVRISVVIMMALSLSRSPQHIAAHCFQVESLLQKCASATIKGLLSCGLNDLRALYGNLQRLSFRERGIRPDQYLAHGWVVMMRVLEHANIPRCSFWDIAQSVMATPALVSGSDAQSFEKLWEDMFTLLPLGEVDEHGVLILGSRRNTPLEGWTLPQRLIKRVFELYQSRTRQLPSFNEYVRALVARCHYLIQQWGWYRCTAIIGTIFDFFGSEELMNLRNEEVYRSPRFLEELTGNPSLSVEPEDRCFHIFIKVVGLAIQRLKQLERHKDISNLVARILPNHDRQYLKEDTVHQRDLAALRNHHDLLCSLFWAAPLELRPKLHLIEKLVMPASAHKEAILINLRAWSQLGRFIISSREGSAEFRPFIVWSNNVFNQVLDQYLSAASDIEQQFRDLSSDIPRVSTAVKDEMIAKNKATAMELLRFSVKTSLDVLRNAANVESTISALNVNQLQKVFTTLDFHATAFDWSVLRVGLETVEYFLSQLDKASEEQYSTGVGEEVNAQQVDDAILLFNEKLARDFFWISRTTIGLDVKRAGKQTAQSLCTEKAVTLAARVAARFVKNGLTRLAPFFSPGKYCLFSGMPTKMTEPERRYLPLFIATLLKNHIFDFKDLGTTIIGLWLLCITQPCRYYGFESYLGEVLKHHNVEFMNRAAVSGGITLDYNASVDLFSCAIHYMRRKLRESESGQASSQLRGDYGKMMQQVMTRMKEDLALIRPEAAEHAAYVDFVREIISMIKSHGVNICSVDPFFTQPGPDYSPPVQDPLMHAAGIMAYGVRLGERDVRAVSQLFHYLYNNFKIALGNGKLEQERSILAKAMSSETNILSFVLEHVLPAAILACQEVCEAWLFLEVYAGALQDVLTRSCVPKELKGMDLPRAVGLVSSVLGWFAALKNQTTLRPEHVHVMTFLMEAAEAVEPSLRTYLYDELDEERDAAERVVEDVASLVGVAVGHTAEALALPLDEFCLERVEMVSLLAGLPLGFRARPDPQAQGFARSIVVDVRKSWLVKGDRVMIQMAAGRITSTPSTTQSGQGTRYGPWKDRDLLMGWQELAKQWSLRGRENLKGKKRVRKEILRRFIIDDMIF